MGSRVNLAQFFAEASFDFEKRALLLRRALFSRRLDQRPPLVDASL